MKGGDTNLKQHYVEFHRSDMMQKQSHEDGEIIHPVTTRIILIILYYALKPFIIDAKQHRATFFFPVLKQQL